MNEEQYTVEILMPLLKHMGYMEVTYNHGVDEFGKDLVFSEYDRFGNKLYHAAQVKAGNISGGTRSEIDDLIGHIVRVFNLEFPDLITKTPVGISHLYVVTSGAFVGNAKTILLNDARVHPYKHRIHFYEGHHIQELQQRSYRNIKELCVAQMNEIKRNKQMAVAVKGLLPNGAVKANYVNHNLPKLIDTLSIFESETILALRRKLELYQLWLFRNNNTIPIVPVLKVIGLGEEEANRDLLEGADQIIQISSELEGLLNSALDSLNL